MMKKITLLLFLLATRLIIAQCATTDITYSYDNGATTDNSVTVIVDQIAENTTSAQVDIFENFDGNANNNDGRKDAAAGVLSSAVVADRTFQFTGLTPGTQYTVIISRFCNAAPPRILTDVANRLNITTTGTAPTDIINLVSVFNSASGGTATNPIATVNRGSTFPVRFTINTNVEITKLTVGLNLVGWNGAGANEDIPGTEFVFNNIPSTGGVDQELIANVTFPLSPTYVGTATWTLDPSQDPTLRPNPQPTALRNDAGSNNTNYRFKFVLDGQSFTSSGLDGDGNIDTVIQAITENPLSVSDLSDKSINGLFYPNPANDVITVSNKVITETYDVIDLYGRTVLSTKATGTLNVSTLTKGVYFLATDAGVAKFLKK